MTRRGAFIKEVTAWRRSRSYCNASGGEDELLD
jgi:hypothetical protein